MNEPKLLPCPFCGNKENISHIELATGHHYLQCNRCGASPYMLYAKDYEMAVEYWNMRESEAHNG